MLLNPAGGSHGRVAPILRDIPGLIDYRAKVTGINPLDDTVHHSALGILQDEACHFRGFVLAGTLVHNDEPCHLRVLNYGART